VAASGAGAEGEVSWGQHGFDAAHRASPDLQVPDRASLLWNASVDHQVVSPLIGYLPAEDRWLIFITDGDGNVVAYDAEGDGEGGPEEVWKTPVGDPGYSTMAYDDGAVFVTGGDDSEILYRLDAATGAIEWSRSVGFGVQGGSGAGISAPLVHDGYVVTMVGLNTDQVTVFDADTGAETCVKTTGGGGYRNVHAVGGGYAFGNHRQTQTGLSRVHALHLASCTLRTLTTSSSYLQGRPAYDAETDEVFLLKDDGSLLAHHATSGASRWSTQLPTSLYWPSLMISSDDARARMMGRKLPSRPSSSGSVAATIS